jgi:prepilin-type N-terminal cleavage/methylation domain-containing protein
MGGPQAEDGFTLLELVVAMSLLAIISTGFAYSVGSGFRTVAIARQRQTAADIVSARLEHLRNVPYDEIALNSAPVQSSDPNDPDSFVSSDGTSYDINGKGDYERLIVDTTNGSVLHFEDPVQVSSTVMRIYQYVTWVDDPSVPGTQDYRRVTVVAQFDAPVAHGGINQFVRTSSLFTTGTVTVGPTGPSTTTTTVPSTTTTIPTTTTTAPAGACSGDTTAPTGSFSITSTPNADVGFTAATNVGLTLSLSDPCTPITVAFSNDGVNFGAPVTYDPLNSSVSWSLSAGDGSKTIYATATDHAGNSRALGTQTLVLDTTHPTVPGTLTRTVACSGSDRTVTLSWGAATDTNFRGYRVYRSTDGVTWEAVSSASSFSYTETHKKSLDSVRFYVVAYDRAGNESNATNTVSLSKNQCS